MFGLDPLRGARRFRDLLMRIGLPAYERSPRSPGRTMMSRDGAER
jgi:hypothetical protein